MKKQYLELIEAIALENIDSWDLISKTTALEEIYTHIHIYRWNCENPHKDWQEDIEKTYFVNNKLWNK